MGLMAVNVTRDGALCGDEALARHLATLPRNAPIIVMVHGYKYDPGAEGRCPHETLFDASAADCGRGVSWGTELGAFDGAASPLCIGFGWPARGSVWRAWHMADRAAAPLAGLLSRIAARGRRAHLVAHSMGARVCLRAVALAPAGSVGRVILLSGAAHRQDARAALTSCAGASIEIVNVSGRENTVFDLLTSAVTGVPNQTIGCGWQAGDPRWLDLRLDRDDTLAALRRLGFPVAPPSARICHWSGYTRAGVFALYRALLADRPLALRMLTPEPATETRSAILVRPRTAMP
ncbi:hypothetical protein PARPLA_00937 [Rhodobacteraceae bacterium THAF1]|uniref:alpha/beta hydrolase n=1 Tax=Palleronia sp. THAF1 TaxID=2587842 RepID=UPI000F3BADB7|nr:alpha/beta hydrolase [Palleronia sp. THAF1]QFU07473.1 hypothetical protein FIU81_02160 [Palleronia sp. THAF1]VDC20404.1 hypothetical protein PARPLA_00937 [Rhodobacteraceae bacterium THAF1]